MTKTIKLFFVGFTFGFFASFILFFFLSKKASNKNLVDIFTPYSIRSSKYKLINPLLDCELFPNNSLLRVNTLKKEVQQIINNHLADNSEVSVYYRDLNNGPWLGINEHAKFAPASLLKVPLMIAYLKKAESNPKILQEKITYSGNDYLEQNLPTSEQLTPKESYTVDQLIKRMVGLSDNIALELLFDHIKEQEVINVYKDLDISYPTDSTPNNYLSVKSYASLFRILYNSTYLSQPMSEKAMNYLTHSDFNLGIKASIPKNITTALKFGIVNPNQYGIKQIHDCGIIYLPQKPYLLCIMTKGSDQDQLLDLIQKISAKIYENVSAN